MTCSLVDLSSRRVGHQDAKTTNGKQDVASNCRSPCLAQTPHCQFYHSNAGSTISQGSAVTRLRCVGVFSNYFVSNLLLNVLVKGFQNSPHPPYLTVDEMLTIIWLLIFRPPCINVNHSVQCKPQLIVAYVYIVES